MPELTVVVKCQAPKGTKVTFSALMPKILCCFEQGEYKVYVGRKCIRKFKHMDNALKKYIRKYNSEVIKAKKMLKAAGEPSLSVMSFSNSETHIGFDNAI